MFVVKGYVDPSPVCIVYNLDSSLAIFLLCICLFSKVFLTNIHSIFVEDLQWHCVLGSVLDATKNKILI